MTRANSALYHGTRLDPRPRGLGAELALVDSADPGPTNGQYRIRAISCAWTVLPSGARHLSYSDLPAGGVHPQLRPAARGGEAIVSEAIFHVAAPETWFDRPAARIALVLLGLLIFYSLLHARTAMLQRRRVELEKLVALRTTELNEQREALERTNLLLSQLATRDPLTELFNRRHFLQLAEAESLRYRRTMRTFSLLLLDVDHFKLVNDTYGHLAGDDVLRSISAVISSSTRAIDVAARFGGEEYIVLLPETNLVQTAWVAERIRAAVQAARIESASEAIHVTVSIGCAEVDAGCTLHELLDRADKALYVAKSCGRNRVELYQGAHSP